MNWLIITGGCPMLFQSNCHMSKMACGDNGGLVSIFQTFVAGFYLDTVRKIKMSC